MGGYGSSKDGLLYRDDDVPVRVAEVDAGVLESDEDCSLTRRGYLN